MTIERAIYGNPVRIVTLLVVSLVPSQSGGCEHLHKARRINTAKYQSNGKYRLNMLASSQFYQKLPPYKNNPTNA